MVDPVVIQLHMLFEQAPLQRGRMMHGLDEPPRFDAASFRRSRASDLSPSLEISALRAGHRPPSRPPAGERFRYTQSARGPPRSPAFAASERPRSPSPIPDRRGLMPCRLLTACIVDVPAFAKHAVHIQRDDVRPLHVCLLAEQCPCPGDGVSDLLPRTSYIFSRSFRRRVS